MKKYLLLISVFIYLQNFAQVNVTTADMPVPGDTIYYTSFAGALPLPVSSTGQNFTWDYSSISGTIQRLDSFIAVTSAPFFYVATFNNPLDPLHKATVSLKTSPPQIGGSFSPITFQDFYSFYRNKSTEYAQVGVGATISINGSSPTPVPAKFSALDIIYKFPLIYGNEDSSKSSYKFDLGATGFFSERRDRHNIVDGFGQLITPFGSYQTMRVKSFSVIEDTVFFNSFPLKFKRYETVYSWLAPGFKSPLLRITQTAFSQNGTPTTQTEYFDFKKLATSLLKAEEISSRINLIGTELKFTHDMENATIYLFSIEGKLLKSGKISNQSFGLSDLPAGILFYSIPEKNTSGKLLYNFR